MTEFLLLLAHLSPRLQEDGIGGLTVRSDLELGAAAVESGIIGNEPENLFHFCMA